MSASNGACKDLLEDTSVLKDNKMDYKSDIHNLKLVLHSKQLANCKGCWE